MIGRSVPSYCRSSFTHMFIFWNESTSVMSYTIRAPAISIRIPQSIAPRITRSKLILTLGATIVDGVEGVMLFLACSVPNGELIGFALVGV